MDGAKEDVEAAIRWLGEELQVELVSFGPDPVADKVSALLMIRVVETRTGDETPDDDRSGAGGWRPLDGDNAPEPLAPLTDAPRGIGDDIQLIGLMLPAVQKVREPVRDPDQETISGYLKIEDIKGEFGGEKIQEVMRA